MAGLVVADLPEELGNRLVARLRYRIARAFNQGMGYFLFFCIFAIATWMFLQLAIYDTNVRYVELGNLLGTPQLARDDEPLITTTASVLAGLEVDATGLGPDGCLAQSESCKVGQGMLADAQLFADAMIATVNPPTTADAGQIAIQFCREKPCRMAEISTVTDIARTLQQQEDAQELVSKTHGATCRSDSEVDQARRQQVFGFGIALCERSLSTRTQLMIPELAVRADDQPPKPDASQEGVQRSQKLKHESRTPDPKTDAKSSSGKLVELLAKRDSVLLPLERVRLQAYYSIALDAALDLASRQGHVLDRSPTGGEGHGVLSAVYFVSPDSVFRIWLRYSEAMILPTSRLWGARAYMTHFLTNPPDRTALPGPPYVSPPYIDVAGAGIVRTYCQLLVAGRNVGSSYVPGVMCFDMAVTAPELAHLAKTLDDGGLIEVAVVHMTGPAAFSIDAHHRAHKAELEALEQSNDWQTYLKHPSLQSRVQKVGDSAWFMVPVGRDAVGSTFFAIKPSVTFVRHRMLWFSVGLCAASALAILILGAWHSRRLFAIETQLARLRSLQVAAIETDANNRIIALNDRAEEILGIQARQFGLSSGARPSFSTVFDTSLMVRARTHAIDGGELWCAEALSEYEPTEGSDGIITVEDVRRDRLEGRTSAYFVRSMAPSQHRSRWILLIASPVVSATWVQWKRRKAGHLDATFGVMEVVVSDAITGRLERSAKQFERSAL